MSIGVGSSSALNAFNIGQKAEGQSAIGQAITAIVAQRDKIEGFNAQSGAQGASGIALQKAKFAREDEPINVISVDPESGLLTDQAGNPTTEVTGRDRVITPNLTESYFKGQRNKERKAEDKERLRIEGLNSGDGVVDQFQGGNVQNVGTNPNVNPLSVAGQGLPAPVELEGTQALKSPEFQGLDPAIFQTPEGQEALRRIIEEKMRAEGGGQV